MRDRAGRTELHYAAVDGQLERVRELLSAGADASAEDNSGWTPLHAAAQSYAVEIATLLIEHGAKADAQDSHGNTPLGRTVFESRGRGEMIALLRRAGADPNHKNHLGISPLDLARTIATYDVASFFADLP